MKPVTLKDAERITHEAADYAICIAIQMLREMPPSALPNLCPTTLLKYALDETDRIMRHRRDFNEPHPHEAKP